MTPTESTAPVSHVRNLTAAMGLVFVCDVALGLTYPLLALVLERRGVDERVIGLNAAMSPLGIIVMGLMLPRLVARAGSAAVAWAGVLALAASVLLLGLFTSLTAWFVLRFVLGFAAGAMFAVSEAWLMHFTADAERGRVTAIYTTLMAIGFGGGAMLLPFTGIDGMAPFVIGAVLIVAGAVPLLSLRLDGSEFSGHEPGTNMVRFAFVAPMLLLGILSMTLFDSTMLAFFPIYALRMELDLKTASWLLGAAITGAALFQLPIGWLADRWSRNGVIWLAALSTIGLALALPLVLKTWAVWPLVILLGTAAYALYALSLVALGDSFRGPMLVAGSAAVAAMWGVGGVIAPPVVGVAFNAVGHESLPWLLAAPYVAFLVLFALAGGHLVRARWRRAA